MAMSSLGNQLAALASATSSNAGTIHSSSRATNDAVGRGFHHSSQHGHALATSGDVSKRASVLYDNAREAAEVTTATLRENALAALQRLAEESEGAEEIWGDADFVGGEGLLSLQKLNHFERGTTSAKDNVRIDKSIEKLLGLLTTVTTERPPPTSTDAPEGDVNSNPPLLAALHVIEYLLRKYEIHARPSTATILLRTFLPLQLAHPAAYPALFPRILALVDLQSVPEWTFLRPYAARNSPPVNRGVIAKRAARDDALVAIVAAIGKRGMEVCVREGQLKKEREMQIDGQDDEGDGAKALAARRGISTLLSVSASILVEALHLQSANTSSIVTGGVKESTVRTLLPLVLGACRSGSKGEVHCAEWKEWGRLVAATIPMLCPLNAEAKTALCDAVVAGLPSDGKKGKKDKRKSFQEAIDGLGRASLSAGEADDAASGVMTLLAVLGARNAETGADDDEAWEHYLPMLPPPKRRGKHKGVVDYLGCDLPPSSYKRLTRENSNVLGAALGAVLRGLGEDDDDEEEAGTNAVMVERLAPLLASIVMHALRRIESEAGKLSKDAKGGKAKFKADRDVILVLGLIQEPTLSSLWRSKSSALVAALTVQTITSYGGLSVDVAQGSEAMILERYSSILKALAAVDAPVHDQGVAYAINTIAKSSGNDKKKMSRLAELLGREIAPPSSNKGAKSKKEGSDVAAIAGLLPARVALEHADASVRLDAVARLKASVEGGDQLDDDLGQALLRRLVADDDAAVASAAGEIVASQLKLAAGGDGMDVEVSGFAALTDDLDGLAKEALAALHRWTFVRKDDAWSPVPPGKKKKGKKRSKGVVDESPLLCCIQLCGTTAKLILEEGSIDDEGDSSDSPSWLFCSLFLSFGAHISTGSYANEGDIAHLAEEASKAASAELSQLLDAKSSDVDQLLVDNSISHRVLKHFFAQGANGMPSVPKALQSRFLWLSLHSYSKGLESDTKKASADALEVALTLAVCQMQSYTKESKKSDTFQWEVQFFADLCNGYLSSLAPDDMDGFGRAAMTLASTSNVAFDEIVKPLIATVSSSKGQSGGLVSLVHACLQPQTSSKGYLRILSIAQESFKGKSITSKVARDCLIPSLALLSHPDREVREQVVGILEQFQSVKKDDMLADICSKATDTSSPLRSSLVMDGANALPNLLGRIVKYSSSSAATQKLLIESCSSCASEEIGTLSMTGCEASAVVLSAMEKAGESAFPLSKRWDLAGKSLFQSFLKYATHDEKPPPSLCRLRDCVISMLKGVLVNEAQAGDDGVSIQISVGPSRSGRRTRSYSIGGSESFSTLTPYPADMLQAILDALPSSSPLLLSKHVVQNVVGRQSWATGVFPKLNSKSKNAIASALLALRTEANDELAGSALFGLPLKASDFIHLLKDVDASRSDLDQAAVVTITDGAQGKLDVLGGTADVSKLSFMLFDQLQLLSSRNNTSGDSGGRDYTRVSLLQALVAIHSHYKNQLSVSDRGSKQSQSRRKRSRSHSDVGTSKPTAAQAKLLVGLVGGNASEIYPLSSGRGRMLSLALLTSLCEKDPSSVASSLLPALMSLAGVSDGIAAQEKVDLSALGNALAAIVPAYCAHAASANLTLFGLLESFVGKIIAPGDNDEELRLSLLDHLVDALKLLPTKENSSDAIASLAACAMALQAFNLQETASLNDEADESRTRLDLRVLANTTSGVKIAVSLALLQYAERIMAYVCGLSTLPEAEASSGHVKVGTSQVASLALRGPNADNGVPTPAFSDLSETQQRSILFLAINLLQSVRDALSTPAARRVVRKSKGDDADLCLRLWNELMQTHSSTLRSHAKLVEEGSMSSMEKRFWSAAPTATSECLDNLQNLLPVPHFLASVSAALGDEDADTYIRKKSMRLLADRVADVNPDTPEASLFIELVPDLVAQITADPPEAIDDGDSLALLRRSIVMKQGALIAIESFARSLASEDGKLGANAAAVFLPALASVTKLLDAAASNWSGDEASTGAMDAECQLLSSSSLCLSTLVKTLQARCLPQLPTIVKPLVASLKSVNAMLLGASDHASSTGELLQLSILKALQAIAETLPQFLLSYLPLIFSDNALPSKTLQQGSARATAAELETSLATKVQIRQLIPSLAQALSKSLQSGEDNVNWEEACSIINVMNIAVESSQRSELSPVIGKIFNGLVLAYGFEGDDASRPQLLQNANKCLLSLVMKLSESQLRPLYARLREWRGGVEDEREETVSPVRRYAFWSLSAELSKSLRSIFLPCLTSVLPDVIDELEIAVSVLCKRSKEGKGSKRRRIEEDTGSAEDIDKVKPLQPLLACLESALKADAHEGGDWTRGDDNQRYNMILNHLGKLLMAQVPGEMSLVSHLSSKEQASTSAYQQLVQGVGTLEQGNVVGCLTALAAAAGNEQLWKPLNFAVLEACGHKRSEVRKAGISCLLSIIETIGEEYMVLLPECLPVLSELLEDEDEIAGMAKECVRQGEELLGESLEDSLR